MSWKLHIPFYLSKRPNKVMANKIGFRQKKYKLYIAHKMALLMYILRICFTIFFTFEMIGMWLVPNRSDFWSPGLPVVASRTNHIIFTVRVMEMKNSISAHSTQNDLALSVADEKSENFPHPIPKCLQQSLHQ